MKGRYETYLCMVLSTRHLKPEDRNAMTCICDGKTPEMILQRDTGFFVKLYEESFLNCYLGLSPAFNRMIVAIRNMGFRLVEFDCDGPVFENFPVYSGEGEGLCQP